MLQAIQSRAERYQRFYNSNKPGDLLIVVRQDPYWVKKKKQVLKLQSSCCANSTARPAYGMYWLILPAKSA